MKIRSWKKANWTSTKQKSWWYFNVPFEQTGDFDHINNIIAHKTPQSFFNKWTVKVMINDRKAAYDAVTYLISKGHKKILPF
jgi:DNA-binding LacI/PurR family transcriptional regulator